MPQGKQLCCASVNEQRNSFQESNYSQFPEWNARTPRLVKDFNRLQMRTYMFPSHPRVSSCHSALLQRAFGRNLFPVSPSRLAASPFSSNFYFLPIILMEGLNGEKGTGVLHSYMQKEKVTCSVEAAGSTQNLSESTSKKSKS